MESAIKKSLLGKLLIVAAVMAVIAGATAFYLEMKEVDDLVLSLAAEESHDMMDHVAFLSLRGSPDYERVRRQVEDRIIEEHLDKNQFVTIELYDPGMQKAISVTQPGFENVARSIVDQTHEFLPGDALQYRKYYVDSHLYFQVFSPLTYAGGEITGYFKGVYAVDPAAMSDIRFRLLWAVLQVVLVVFITTLALYPVIISLTRNTIRLSEDIADANLGMMMMLGSAVAKRDRETNSHNYRVTIYAIRLAEAVGLRKEQVHALIKGAFLHDVGKIGISDTVLHKPDRLTEDEFRVMATHVQHGVDILGRYQWLKDAMDVVRYHHEKFDGSGYFEGLAGDRIPMTARIFTIVDVFDALTSKRPYKDAASLEETLSAMEAERSTRFDPALLDRFNEIAPELYREVSVADEDRLIEMVAALRDKYFGSPRRMRGSDSGRPA
jgi:putative nucleotidyltransferase with HDIG domain